MPVVRWPPNTGCGGGPDAPIFQPDGGVAMPVAITPAGSGSTTGAREQWAVRHISQRLARPAVRSPNGASVPPDVMVTVTVRAPAGIRVTAATAV